MIEADCTDALALISTYQSFLKSSGRDINPRLIAWGLRAIERRGGSVQNVKRGWEGMSVDQRWRRVRAFLSAAALNTLAGILAAEYGSPVEQLSLGLGDGETATSEANTAHNL